MRKEFKIPKEILEEINTKGFYVYKRIDVKEFLMGTINGFTMLLNKYTFFGFLFVIFFMLPWEEFNNLNYFFLMLLSCIVSFLFIPTLLILFDYGSYFLKNNYVILLNSHIVINKKIFNLKRNKEIKKEVNYIGDKFQEYLFEKNTSKEKFKKLFQKILDSFKPFTYYTPFIIIFYIFFTLFFPLFLIITLIYTLFLKLIIIIRGHKILKIKNIFKKIDKNSNILQQKKENLINNLKEAQNNNYKDGLLLKIKKEIENIGKNVRISIKNSIKLEKKLQKFKYKIFFDFQIYTSWIKSQIYEPLNEIEELLVINYKRIKNEKFNLEKQIKETQDANFKQVLTLQNHRIDLTLQTIEKNIEKFKFFKESFNLTKEKINLAKKLDKEEKENFYELNTNQLKIFE